MAGHAAISALRVARPPKKSGRSGGITLSVMATQALLSFADINTPTCLELPALAVTERNGRRWLPPSISGAGRVDLIVPSGGPTAIWPDFADIGH